MQIRTVRYLLIFIKAFIVLGLITALILRDRETGIVFLLFSPFLFFRNRRFYRLMVFFLPFPGNWRAFSEKYSPYYPLLDKKTRKRFEGDFRFFSELDIKGKGGGLVKEEFRLYIALGFATLLIGRPGWELPVPGNIIVRPEKSIVRENETGTHEFAAIAGKRVLLLTEENLLHSYRVPDDKYNNIYHEMIHYFDMEDYVCDGIPSAKRLGGKVKQSELDKYWRAVLDAEFEKAKKGELKIRRYAKKNIGEFFACAGEYFFEQPKELLKDSKALYDLFQGFFNFDPAKLLDRS
ncbi:MAG: zinc-dependent peptidase [bacterium]|nr:zinc-dependent peptidase [bacterium]